MASLCCVASTDVIFCMATLGISLLERNLLQLLWIGPFFVDVLALSHLPSCTALVSSRGDSGHVSSRETGGVSQGFGLKDLKAYLESSHRLTSRWRRFQGALFQNQRHKRLHSLHISVWTFGFHVSVLSHKRNFSDEDTGGMVWHGIARSSSWCSVCAFAFLSKE